MGYVWAMCGLGYAFLKRSKLLGQPWAVSEGSWGTSPLTTSGSFPPQHLLEKPTHAMQGKVEWGGGVGWQLKYSQQQLCYLGDV